jgi:hypothetical protein
MADENSLLDKADSLIQRHRPSGTAGGPHQAVSENDDLPMLTDVIVTEDMGPAAVPAFVHIAPPDPEHVAELAREMLLARLPAQRQAIAGELAAWLDKELPPVVLRVLDGIADQIIAQVTTEALATLMPRMQAALDEESQSSRDAG